MRAALDAHPVPVRKVSQDACWLDGVATGDRLRGCGAVASAGTSIVAMGMFFSARIFNVPVCTMAERARLSGKRGMFP